MTAHRYQRSWRHCSSSNGGSHTRRPSGGACTARGCRREQRGTRGSAATACITPSSYLSSYESCIGSCNTPFTSSAQPEVAELHAVHAVCTASQCMPALAVNLCMYGCRFPRLPADLGLAMLSTWPSMSQLGSCLRWLGVAFELLTTGFRLRRDDGMWDCCLRLM